ncbi:MAG: hypothetical protein J6K81_00580 [Rikenellaceae bacterium]|nr:hypothetical protein [Rikenellaceae bacterium]
MNQIKFIRSGLILAITLLLAVGCKRIVNPFEVGTVIARVGETTLYERDLAGIVPAGISSADSLKLVESHVNSWVRKELKRQEAHRLLESSAEDIEQLVEEYRNSLLTRRLEQYYVEQMASDSLFGESDLLQYYESHKGDFKLKGDIVKGRIVAMPKTFRQKAKIKELLKASSAEKQNDLKALCEKNKLQLTELTEWTDFSAFLAMLPTKRNESYRQLLREGVVDDMTDGPVSSYFIITELKTAGSVSPYETVKDMIRWAVDKQRRAEIVRQCDDSLYQRALREQIVEINLNKE